MVSRIEQPRAFKLAPDEPFQAVDDRVEVLLEAEPVEALPVLPTLPARRHLGWIWVFVSAVGGLALVSLYLWAQNAVIAALRQSDTLGLIALALAAVAAVAALVLALRFMRDLLRQRKIERLKHDAAAALAARSGDAARVVANEIVALQASRPTTAAGRARFAEALPAMTDARDILALAERELLEPLDALAAAEISRAARQVSVVTAVSPRALVDIVFVVFACARLLKAVTAIYGGRPGTLGLLRIAKASVSHLLVTGGLAAGDAVLQQVVGQGLAARLSAKLGEGVLNGLMTARFGLAALAVCRPLPFVESKAPSLGDVAAGLLSGKGDKA